MNTHIYTCVYTYVHVVYMNMLHTYIYCVHIYLYTYMPIYTHTYIIYIIYLLNENHDIFLLIKIFEIDEKLSNMLLF